MKTELKPHQQRVVDRIARGDQPGLVVAHGLGAGKTLAAIAASKALGGHTRVVVPAALQDNFHKELKKHVGGSDGFTVESMQGIARKGYVDPSDNLVIDEAHRMRNQGSKTEQALGNNSAAKRLLLTASPFYNNPAEIAPLINLAAGGRVLPEAQAEFMKRFTVDKTVDVGVINRVLHGASNGVETTVNPAEAERLKKILAKWVDYHPNSSDGFPSVERKTVEVPMTSHQQRVYDTAMGRAPAWLAWKIKAGMPLSKTESKQMNAFMGAVRQVSNTTRGYYMHGEPDEPKIEAAVASLEKHLQDPLHKAIVYSNYIESGIEPYRERLAAKKIDFGEYTGEVSKKNRDQLVRDFNAGKKRVILMTSAAGEGLDLKGNTLAQILDPHFNSEKIRQVEGRAIRYLSHAGLPADHQKVLVESYLATRAPTGIFEGMGWSKPGKSSDQYLTDMAKTKDDLNEKFRALFHR